MSKDPCIRMAIKLASCLDRPHCGPRRQFQSALEDVTYHHLELQHQVKVGRLVRQRDWPAAAAQSDQSVIAALHRLQSKITEAIQVIPPRGPMPRAGVSDVYQEIRQLHDEFSIVDLDLKNRVIAVQTDDIELEDIYLGPFRIELHVAKLRESATAEAFAVKAVDPHPAGSDDRITHPHVKDNHVCAGDATVPIANALRDGRICDAFLAIQSVLNTYNSGSPFVSLDDWEGEPCADCGYHVTDSYFCEDCERDFCDDCFTCCDVCDHSCCKGCLEVDPVSDQRCCRRCHQTCDSCDRIVANENVQEGLCPECFKREEEQTESDEPEVIQQEITHEHCNHRPTEPDSSPTGISANPSQTPSAAA